RLQAAPELCHHPLAIVGVQQALELGDVAHLVLVVAETVAQALAPGALVGGDVPVHDRVAGELGDDAEALRAAPALLLGALALGDVVAEHDARRAAAELGVHRAHLHLDLTAVAAKVAPDALVVG